MTDKNLAGKKLYEYEFPVERGKIREFATAIRDPNPIYRDREYARRMGFEDVLMPVTFPLTFLHHVGPENFAVEIGKILGQDPTKTVQGSCEIVFERPICAGECLRGEIRIGNIYEKEAKRGGTMTFVEQFYLFYDVEDRLVIEMLNLVIERD